MLERRVFLKAISLAAKVTANRIAKVKAAAPFLQYFQSIAGYIKILLPQKPFSSIFVACFERDGPREG